MARYESLEEALANSKDVTELDFSEQELEELSARIGQLTNLQWLSFNPDEMCSQLEEDADRRSDHLINEADEEEYYRELLKKRSLCFTLERSGSTSVKIGTKLKLREALRINPFRNRPIDDVPCTEITNPINTTWQNAPAAYSMLKFAHNGPLDEISR